MSITSWPRFARNEAGFYQKQSSIRGNSCKLAKHISGTVLPPSDPISTTFSIWRTSCWRSSAPPSLSASRLGQKVSYRIPNRRFGGRPRNGGSAPSFRGSCFGLCLCLCRGRGRCLQSRARIRRRADRRAGGQALSGARGRSAGFVWQCLVDRDVQPIAVKRGYDRPARSRRSRPPPVLRRSPEVVQRLRHAVKNPRPIAAPLLPEQPHRRIPGAVLAIEKPATVRHLFQDDPHRSAGHSRAYAIDVAQAIIKSRFAMAPVFVAGLKCRMAFCGAGRQGPAAGNVAA